jgi:hypothetical protein
MRSATGSATKSESDNSFKYGQQYADHEQIAAYFIDGVYNFRVSHIKIKIKVKIKAELVAERIRRGEGAEATRAESKPHHASV